MLDLTIQPGLVHLTHSGPFNEIADVLSDAIITTDAEHRIVRWNQRAEMLFGYSRTEATGQVFTQICPPVSQEESDLINGRLSLGKDIRQFKTHRITKQGKRVAVMLNLVALRNEAGNLTGATYIFQPAAETSTVGTLRHVAGLKRTQGEHFRAFTDAVADMLWAADANGDGIYLGIRFAQYLGYDLSELQGRTWLTRIVHPEEYDQADARWSMALRTGERFEAEARLRRFDGAYRWFVVRGLPLFDEDGAISEWIGSCTDIDDLKRSEQTLLRSNEELKQFAYAAAHDLQEPLRNVATSVGMLKRQLSSELHQDVAPWIEASIEGAQRLHAMVKDLLTFSTILDDAQHAYDRCSLEQAFSKAVAILSPTIIELGASIQNEGLPEAGIHAEHAVQIFHNLLDNALKYRDPERPPVISINAARHESGWMITVEDNGIGFDRAYAALIFRVFKRLHQRDTYAGNGIGLAICQRIVSHYGGRIWAEASPGAGAVFHFTIPGCPA